MHIPKNTNVVIFKSLNMYRQVAATELARLLAVLSHPARLRIVEELREGERDVNTLMEVLGISHSGVSQHLAKLRDQRVVDLRREGRHTFYRLRDPALAEWIAAGLGFVLSDSVRAVAVGKAAARARRLWSPSSAAR